MHDSVHFRINHRHVHTGNVVASKVNYHVLYAEDPRVFVVITSHDEFLNDNDGNFNRFSVNEAILHWRKCDTFVLDEFHCFSISITVVPIGRCNIAMVVSNSA